MQWGGTDGKTLFITAGTQVHFITTKVGVDPKVWARATGQSEQQPQPEQQPQSEQPQPEQQPPSDQQPQPEQQSQPEPQPETQSQPEPQSQPDQHPQSDEQSQPQPEPPSDQQPQPDQYLQPEQQPLSNQQPQPEPQSQPEQQPPSDQQPQPEQQSQPEPQPQSYQQPQSEQQSQPIHLPQPIVPSFSLQVTKADSQVFDTLLDSAQNLNSIPQSFILSEGPVWVGNVFLFSDVTNDTQWQWDPVTAELSVFRYPSGNANGQMYVQGSLLNAKHNGQVTSTNTNTGKETVLVQAYQGIPFNSPNDLAYKSDGSVWFTDPGWGCCLTSSGINNTAEPQQGEWVYRYSTKTRVTSRVAPTPVANATYLRPNGIAFGLNENVLYFSTYNAVYQCDVSSGSPWVSACRAFVSTTGGDGIRVDARGDVWVANSGKISIFTSTGTLIGTISIPGVTNFQWGGTNGLTLLVTATSKTYYFNTLVGVDPTVWSFMNDVPSPPVTPSPPEDAFKLWGRVVIALGVVLVFIVVFVVIFFVVRNKNQASSYVYQREYL